MPTPRETILVALHARLSTLPATALRGDVLPERVPADGLLILRDGEPGEPEVTLSPLRYHYQHAAKMLVGRHDQIDGDHYEILAPAAEELSERHPLAATVALRAMIDFTLREARQKRYGYAAQHLATCADLADRIKDFAPLEPHEAYVARLRASHGKKTGFWGQLA